MGAEQFAVPFASALVVVCIAERCLHAVLCLMFRISPLKHMAAQGVITWLVQLGACTVLAVLRAAVSILFTLTRWWLWMLAVLAVFTTLWVTYDDYPQTWLGFVDFYNAWLGPFVASWVVVPLELADVLTRGVIPLYDGAVWWLKTLLLQGVQPTILAQLKVVLQLATALFDCVAAFATAWLSFVQSFECVGATCLVQETRAFDFLTAMGHFREAVALFRLLFASFCSFLSAPLDVALFPLLDLNFAEGLHNLWNAGLQAVFVVPQMAVARCQLASDDAFGLILCTPDFEPVFNYLSAGVANLGLAVDDWTNAATLIVQSVLTNTTVPCAADPTEVPLESWLGNAALFGQNFTALVGLSEWMYAVTDGYTAVYVGGPANRTQRWPFAMDPTLGVAAVAYGGFSDVGPSTATGSQTAGALQTTAMLACNCTDVAGGVEILCAILPFSGATGAASNYLLQVLFPDTLVAGLLGACANVDIQVHSNRFPATRTETVTVGVGAAATSLPMPDCATRSACREVDAVVYVTPKCAQGGGAGCLSSCFPFCMAARDAGSQNNNLVLAPASRWRQGYTVLSQDCAISGATVASVSGTLPATGASSTVASPPGALTGAGVFTSEPVPQACVPAKRVRSFVERAGPTSLRAAVRLPGQPVFATGDTVFTQRTLGGNALALVVERLTSDDHNTLTLETLSQDFPAQPPLEVQSQEFTDTDSTQVLVPPAAGVSPIVAVSSRCEIGFYYGRGARFSCARASRSGSGRGGLPRTCTKRDGTQRAQGRACPPWSSTRSRRCS